MHAQRIIQDLLDTACPNIHLKRRKCIATIVDAGSRGKLFLMGISRSLSNATSIRHRIKRCDRLLGNHKLEAERLTIYGAMTKRILLGIKQPLIIIDWSDLLPDRSLQLLRAAVVIKGRAMTIYEEVHPISCAMSPTIHRDFLDKLRTILPSHSQPICITDAGFRSTWFALLNQRGWAWVGRIRNRDMVLSAEKNQSWIGCKTLYSKASCQAKDLGKFQYVRKHPVACRLVIIKKKALGRHQKTVRGEIRKSAQSLKQSQGQKEPWLLVVSPLLNQLSAEGVVAIYRSRMQIEQTFRDVKNSRWGLSLSESQTRQPRRLATLLLIGALACYALWIIGLLVKSLNFSMEFGSKKKAKTALSTISLARCWIRETSSIILTARQINNALSMLRTLILDVHQQILQLQI